MKFWIVMVLMLMGVSIQGASLEEAELLYRNQDYQGAQQMYEALLNDFPHSEVISYNLGNTYFKQDMLGKAIYYYKKALFLVPRDVEAMENLNLARSMVVGYDNENQQRELLSFLSIVTGKQLLLLSIGVMLVLNGLVYAYFKTRKELLKNIGILGGLLAIIVISFLIIREVRDSSHQESVIIVKKTAVKSGPSESFKELFFIHEGYELRTLLSQDGWSKVRLSNGAVGWVEDRTFWSL